MTTANSIMGSINRSEKRTAFLPRRLILYATANKSDMPR